MKERKQRRRRRMLWVIALCIMLTFMFAGKKEVHAQSAKMQSLVAVMPKAGFHPSSGNYILIKASTLADVSNQSIRFRVVNSKGKYIFQKTVCGLENNAYTSVKWDGKAIKNNTAGLKTGTYIKPGTYQIQALLYYTNSKGNKSYSKKIISLKVSNSAPSGKSALGKVVSIPMLTGDKNIDYVAEQMVKAAGVTSAMTQDQKVKKIYHWITVNFHHVHYNYAIDTYKRYYNVTNLASKINAYRTTCNKKIANGTMIYNYYSPYLIIWNMERKIGVCTDHARVFKIMCNHVGVEAEVCSGKYINRNGTTPPHSWNSAVINGTTYYYDVDVELQNYGKGQGDYYWYKKTRKEAEKTHIFQ